LAAAVTDAAGLVIVDGLEIALVVLTPTFDVAGLVLVVVDFILGDVEAEVDLTAGLEDGLGAIDVEVLVLVLFGATDVFGLVLDADVLRLATVLVATAAATAATTVVAATAVIVVVESDVVCSITSSGFFSTSCSDSAEVNSIFGSTTVSEATNSGNTSLTCGAEADSSSLHCSNWSTSDA
jgi:hypothetical protein